MGIFGKLKGAKKAADEHKAQEAPSPEDVAKPRYVHVPTHAARDAMSIAPSGWKGSDKELITQANKARMSRTGSDFESYFYRSPNPKFARSSSGLSMSGDWNGSAGPSAPSSPMGSRPQSYQSLPRLMHEGPPVPAIPSQYAGQSTSPVLGAGNRDSSSFNGVPSKRRLSRTTSGLGKSPVQNYCMRILCLYNSDTSTNQHRSFSSRQCQQLLCSQHLERRIRDPNPAEACHL